MTTYRHPDYDVALMIELTEFRQMSGKSFIVSVAFRMQRERVDGMLIIPEWNIFPDASATCEAWLWADECTDMAPHTEVDIQISDTCDCDHKLVPQKGEQALPYFGLHLKGKITRNWKFEAPTAAGTDKPHR